MHSPVTQHIVDDGQVNRINLNDKVAVHTAIPDGYERDFDGVYRLKKLATSDKQH